MIPIVPIISAILIIIVLDVINSLYLDIFLFFYFLFTFINVSGAFTQSTFYLIALLFYFILRIGKVAYAIQDKNMGTNILGFKFTKNLPLLEIGMGVGIFLLMLVIQQGKTGLVIGVPTLAAVPASSTFFTIWTMMFLGVVENKLIFTLIEFFSYSKIIEIIFSPIPIISQIVNSLSGVLPIIAGSIMFTLFHLTAYSSQISSLLFAFLIFMIYSTIYFTTKQDLAPNIAHALWNGLITAFRTLKIV